jgi:hypothetical protein
MSSNFSMSLIMREFRLKLYRYPKLSIITTMIDGIKSIDDGF